MNCPHHKLLLRDVTLSQPLAAVICNEGGYCTTSDIVNEVIILRSTMKFENNLFPDKMNFYLDAFSTFECQFVKLKVKMKNVLILHCTFMEIYHRLLLVPTIPMRTVRRYVLNHFVLILKTLKDVNYLMSGQLLHKEDIQEMLPKFIHPTLTGLFPRASCFPSNHGESPLSVCSFRGLIFLRDELLNADVCQSASDVLNNTDGRRNSIRELIQVWVGDLVDMLETLQIAVDTKICVGFEVSEEHCFYNYTLRNPSHGRFDFNISAQTLKVAINFDYEEINNSIRNVLITEAFGCKIASDVSRDQNYQVMMNRLVETRLCNYEASASNLWLTERIARRNRYFREIENNAEEADYW
jgi:hypothetical protein